MPALIAGVGAALDDRVKWERIWREANVRNAAYLPYDASLGVPSPLQRTNLRSCEYCTTEYVLSDVQVRCPSCGAPPHAQVPPVVFAAADEDFSAYVARQNYLEARKTAMVYGTAMFRLEMGVKVTAD